MCVGVVDIKPYSYVRGMVKKINESIESFDKTSMIHVMYLEKNPLPTAEGINICDIPFSMHYIVH